MIYLILAVVCSALISIFMRISEKRISDTMSMFSVNYLVCLGISALFTGRIGTDAGQDGLIFAVCLGILTGIFYLVNFVLLQKNIQKNGVVLAGTFMKLGVLIPTFSAVLFFSEKLKILQIPGILLALLAILLIHLEKGSFEEGRHKIWLIILLVFSGMTDTLLNVYDKIGNAGWKDLYLLLTFAAAFVIAGIAAAVRKKKPGLWDFLFGILIGVPNYFSARCLLNSLESVPAVIVYPVYSVATIVVITLAGVVFFKEKMTAKKWIALGMILAALVLLNL